MGAGGATKDAQAERLRRKVAILEAMVEDRTREAYLEQKRGAVLIELHKESMRAHSVEPLLERTLDLLLSGGFLQIENSVAVFLTDAEGKNLLLAARRNLPPEVKHSCRRVAFGQCLCGIAAKSRTSLFAHSGDSRHTWRYDGMAPHGHYCVPIAREERTMGVICLFLPAGREQDEEETLFLGAVADILAGCLQRIAYEESLANYQNGLERMVEEQTRELQQANDRLRREIAERILVEKALMDAEQRYRSIFENAVDGIYQSSLDGRMLNCNLATARIFGYQSTAEALSGLQNVGKWYVNPGDREVLLERLGRGPVSGFETRMRRRDGRSVWVTVNARLAKDFTSGALFVEGILQDVTFRKEAEEALAEEKERLAVTLASIGDGVITTDTEGRIVLVNPVAQQLTGWSQDEASGRPLTEVFHIVDARSRKVRENPVDKVLSSNSIVELANHTVLVSRDGTERSIADSGAPIRDRHDRIIGVVLVFRDVTDRERMEQEILKIKKLESLGVLAGGIAHDFNNILAAIVGNIHLARLGLPQMQRERQLLEEAEKASFRARDLTQQLLTFAKGDEPVRETASIGDVVRTSTDFILRGSKVAPHYDIPEDLWLVDIDTSQMSQVVQNLVLNANQAMEKGGVLSLRCDNYRLGEQDKVPLPPGNFVRLVIADQGEGISAEFIDRIFDPYFTQRAQGSGLGLAITHSIISRHDGHISVASEPGKGAEFTILLPASSKETQTETAVECFGFGQGSGRVLLMDDDAMVRKVACAMLEACGYETLAAVDGGEALVLYQQAGEEGQGIDLVILDLTVPGAMGGVEALGKLREIDPAVRAIVSSGYSSDPVMANYQEYGFLEAVRKPYLLESLIAAVQKALKD